MKLEEIKELIDIFDNSSLGKLEIKQENFELGMEKPANGPVAVVQTPVQHYPAPHVHPVEGQHIEVEKAIEKGATKIEGDQILSPMVGTFYRSPAPNAAAFANVGDTIRKGSTLCILEAMKIMNELEADFDCKILDILVEDGEPIEYGAPLFVVEKL